MVQKRRANSNSMQVLEYHNQKVPLNFDMPKKKGHQMIGRVIKH